MLQCDGFGVYETLNKKIDSLALMNCMAHIRREFFDAQSNDAQRAQTALTLIQLLYQVEEKARNLGLNPEQRLELRLQESKPIFDQLGQWLRSEYNRVTPASAIGKAIQYALNRWKTCSCSWPTATLKSIITSWKILSVPSPSDAKITSSPAPMNRPSAPP
ncbi:MAG: transposase [Saprospirales bacterium]|nr:transposase [Saprospirales bacterium]